METVEIWYYISNNGDGSACLKWYLDEKDVIQVADEDDEGWAEPCHDSVITIKGSKHHIKAILNSYGLANRDQKGKRFVVNPLTFEVSELETLDDAIAFGEQFKGKGFNWSDLYLCY